MRRFRFPIAVALTSIALVAVLGVAVVLAAPVVLASAIGFGGPGPFGPPFDAVGHTLPSELQGLATIPPAERFSHFRGVQISLTDQNDRPLMIAITPGVITSVDTTRVTLTTNDGTAKTYTLDDRTIVRGKAARGGDRVTQPALAVGDKVVVATINNDTTARAVVAINPDGFGPRGRFGPFGPGR